MASNNEIGVGLLGLGVIGSQVAAHLLSHSETLSSHLDRQLVLRRVLVRDVAASRSVTLPEGLLTDDFDAVLNDPDIQIVVEVMGSEDPAASYLTQLLQKGKSVVTANKEVMAKHGQSLMEAADHSGAKLRFEASVGGGIPIIGPLQNDLLANDISSIRAIINGTTNYILSKMSREGVAFSVALAEAQSLGYAEPDPTNDIEGIDAAYKIAILASLAFHAAIAPQQVYCEGITDLQAEDFEFARELGYEIKLLAIAQRTDDGVQARVHPALVHKESILAKVEGPFNAVEVFGDLVGPVVFHGQGAGPAPTTSAIIGDILSVARSDGHSAPVRPWSALPIKAMAELETQYYLRVSIADQSGVLSQIARVFGDNDISIATLTQKDVGNQQGTAQLVITTHVAREAAMQAALKGIKELSVLREVHNLLRVEPI
ncbi:MAG: homoserine dehydrogenase [SAR202 cluster bacterium]|nr:homoserine dehydrogenase [SAR202 cluster bacterium]